MRGLHCLFGVRAYYGLRYGLGYSYWHLVIWRAIQLLIVISIRDWHMISAFEHKALFRVFTNYKNANGHRLPPKENKSCNIAEGRDFCTYQVAIQSDVNKYSGPYLTQFDRIPFIADQH